MSISRRHLIAAAPVALALAAAGCAASTTDGITTVTVNLTTVDAYAEAISNAVATLLTVPALSAGLGAVGVAAVTVAKADIVSSISALDTANSGSESFTFTTASVPAALSALRADANKIMSNISTVVASLGGSLAASVVTTVDALETIVALTVALVPTVALTAAAPKMTEVRALATLGVTKR
jgi:hypothetical protein